MTSVRISLSGMAGLGVALLSVAVAAYGYAHNEFLAAICAALGILAVLVYIGMAIDRYDWAKQHPYS